jgi:hypothetical protein
VVAGLALQAALATHTVPRGPLPANYWLWRHGERDETDWADCGFAALTLTAGMQARAVRQERKGWPPRWRIAREEGGQRVQALWADLAGNWVRPVPFSPTCRTSTAVLLAQQMYEARDFSAMPILADALQDAGCDESTILDHCRGPGPHARGCWVVDLVLGKEDPTAEPPAPPTPAR